MDRGLMPVNTPVATETLYDFDRAEMVAFVPPSSAKVLDIGCATGRFGGLLKSLYGTRVIGVEPDPDAAASAATLLDKVFLSTLQSQ